MNHTPESLKTLTSTEIERMLKNSQTKVIMPIVTLGLLESFLKDGNTVFSDSEIRFAYQKAVRDLKKFLGHQMHIGAKYEDAYGMRMSRYGVLKPLDHLKYQLQEPFVRDAARLVDWIPLRIRKHIDDRLGIVPQLGNITVRTTLAENEESFLELIRSQIDKTPANFEIFGFAIIKVHLEKFACKIYRDTRTASHDKGVDISTNFGVVYQIKKLKIYSKPAADKVYAELRMNFDSERLQDGNVILVIDDITKDIRQYLIDMRVQSISKEDILKVAAGFEEPEDRQRILRIVHEEFNREYSSTIN